MTTWVLLRGLMRETRHWGDFPRQMQHALGVNVMTPDMPGNGSLYKQASAWSVQEMTESCRAQLLRRSCVPPYDLLAMSLGAMVAIDWATRYPQEVRRMVLINTSLATYNPFYQRLLPRNYFALLAMLLWAKPEQRENLILRITSHIQRDGVAQQQLLTEWHGYARSCPVSRCNILRQLYAAARYRAPAVRPAVPVLMLASSNDSLVDVSCSRTIAAQWDCQLYEHPSAGHDLPLDDGAWVIQNVQGWL